MKINTHTVVKSLVLFVFWLVFPPLFLFFSVIWEMPRLTYRIVLTLIAPFTLFAFLMSWVVFENYYTCYFSRGTRTEIETKTGVDFPKYKILEKRHLINGPWMSGDFDMKYSVKLDTVGIRDFYLRIEKQMEKRKDDSAGNDSYWSVDENGNYRFSLPGVEPETQETLELLIDKSNAVVKIAYGSW
jgi:hypothetical protein